MLFLVIPMPDVFCDWLDVTCSPDDSFIDKLHLYFDTLCCPVLSASDDHVLISVGEGKVVFNIKSRFHRSSVSGAVLRYLRERGKLDEYLYLLSTVPHKVTRLDAALDVSIDGPVVLRMLEQCFPDGKVSLTRKALQVTTMYSIRADGESTGTYYIGHRSNARVTARVYDKQAEMLAKGAICYPPTTRFELTFKKDHGCTLRDASMPKSLFYQYASPTLLERPDDVPDWEANSSYDWTGTPVAPAMSYALYKRRVELSPEVDRLASLAAELGPQGVTLALRAFEAKLRSHLSSDSAIAAPVDQIA